MFKEKRAETSLQTYTATSVVVKPAYGDRVLEDGFTEPLNNPELRRENTSRWESGFENGHWQARFRAHRGDFPPDSPVGADSGRTLPVRSSMHVALD